MMGFVVFAVFAVFASVSNCQSSARYAKPNKNDQKEFKKHAKLSLFEIGKILIRLDDNIMDEDSVNITAPMSNTDSRSNDANTSDSLVMKKCD